MGWRAVVFGTIPIVLEDARLLAALGNCSCVALSPASMQSSATAPALLYLLHPCSRRQLLLRCSISCIHAVVGNCSCVALSPASMQSSATAPALLYLLHPCSRRQLLLRCSTSCIHAVVGNCSCVALSPASMQSSATAPALLYLLHPCSRRQLLLRCSISCIHAVVGNCSCVALSPASMQSSATAPALLYLLHPCSRHSSNRLLFVGSRGFAQLPPTCISNSNGYIIGDSYNVTQNSSEAVSGCLPDPSSGRSLLLSSGSHFLQLCREVCFLFHGQLFIFFIQDKRCQIFRVPRYLILQ